MLEFLTQKKTLINSDSFHYLENPAYSGSPASRIYFSLFFNLPEDVQ